MKKRTFFKSFMAVVMLAISMGVSAQNTLSGTCPGYCNPTGAGATATATDAFYMTVNTEANGDVTISILGVPNNTTTAFRNEGWQNGRVELLTVNGDANTGNKYFTRTISSDKKTITLVKQSDISAGASIEINQILEYKTADSGDESNLWPTIDLVFTYGTNCSFAQTPLAAPSITNIDADKKITFSPVTNAASYMADVFRDDALVYSQIVSSGDVINYTPTLTYNYTVKLKSISNDILYTNSVYSTGYTWHLEAGVVTLDPSIYCNHLIGSGNSSAYLSWQTDANGNVVISISGYAGDANTAFRGGGLGANLSNFTVNGNPASNYFTRTYTTGGTTYTLTKNSGASILPGDKISYTNGTVEWKTTGNTNAYGAYTFANYVYGSDCSSLPTVTATPANITFTPTTGTKTFTVTGTNLSGDVIVIPPRGLSVSPSTITPDENGDINQIVTATWTTGASSGSIIQISGGGLVSNVPVLVNATGFSGFCNKVISQENNGTWAAYMSVAMSSDKTQMVFTIAPYATTGETATWNTIAEVVVNGGTANAMVASKVYSTDKSECTVTFNSALTNGDLVTFGNPLVWTVVRTATSNNNVYINAIQGPYTVGQTCNLDSGPTTTEPNIMDQELTVYPNPAKDQITISGEVQEVALYSLQGQLIHFAKNTNTVNVSSVAEGLYIVKMTNKSGKIVSSKLEIR